MAVLEPKLAMLDETDSGLDIDALRVVANGVNSLRAPGSGHRAGDALPAPARLHRARLRARAVRRPHPQERRQVHSRSNSRSAATTGSGRRPRSHERRGCRAMSSPATGRRSSRAGPSRARPGARARGVRALRRAWFPGRARRGLEVHEPAAPRVPSLRCGAAHARAHARSAGIAQLSPHRVLVVNGAVAERSDGRRHVLPASARSRRPRRRRAAEHTVARAGRRRHGAFRGAERGALPGRRGRATSPSVRRRTRRCTAARLTADPMPRMAHPRVLIRAGSRQPARVIVAPRW